MLSLNSSLNSGLLVPFTVLVLSLWASSYTHKDESIKTTYAYKQSKSSKVFSLSEKDSYRTGKRKLKLHTGI